MEGRKKMYKQEENEGNIQEYEEYEEDEKKEEGDLNSRARKNVEKRRKG